MEIKKTIEVGDMVQITMITREGVARQRFIPTLDTAYKVTARTENSIQLYNEKYGTYTYYKLYLHFKFKPWKINFFIGRKYAIKWTETQQVL